MAATGKSRTMNWALWLFAVSGFCGMAYEVLWTRLLGLIVGPTTYSFSIVISTFIIGLAMGSIIFGWLADRMKRVFPLLIFTQLCASVLALVVSQFLGKSQFLFSKLICTFHTSFSTMILIQSIVLFAILIGPTLFLGAAFPLVNRIYIQSMSDFGKSLGTAYALNTVGAILGSFMTGFFLVPLIGKENGLRLIIIFQFSMTMLAVIHVMLMSQKRTGWLLAVAGLCFCGVLLMFHFPSWNHELLSRGWYRDFDVIEHELKSTGWFDALWKGPTLLAKQRAGLEVVFHGEGIGGFTTVEKETTSLGTVEYAMFNSGKADASSPGDRSTQTLSAHIPMLFHPHPEKVMVLGLASGMTPGEVLLYPIKQLDIVEINDQVVKACELFFTPWNNDCLRDSRTRLIIQDGRNHLALTSEKYDLIISEPSNPWMAGLANLFSLEFFQLVKQRLNHNGIFAQWIQSYEIDWNTFTLLGRTFTKVFSDGVLIKIGPVDYLLVGLVNNNKLLNWPTAEKHLKFACQSTNVSFAGVNYLSHLIITEDLKGLFGPGPIHTDNRPRLEFLAPRKLYFGSLNVEQSAADKRRLSPETREVLEIAGNSDTMLDLVEFAASAYVPLFSVLKLKDLQPKQKDRYMKILRGYCEQTLVPTYGILGEPESKRQCAGIQISKIKQKFLIDDSRPVDHYNLSLALIAAGQTEQAVQELRTTVSLDPFHERGYTALGLLLSKTGSLPEAIQCFSRVIKISPQDAEAFKNLGMAELRHGMIEQAIVNLSKAFQIAPDDVGIINELGISFLRQGKVHEAIQLFTKALRIKPQEAEAHHNLATAYYQG